MSTLSRYLFILLIAAGAAGIIIPARAAFPVPIRKELKSVIIRTDDEQSMLHNRTVLDRMFYKNKKGEPPRCNNMAWLLVLTGATLLVPCLSLLPGKTNWHLSRS
jgi:hypothetical protein